MQAAVRKAVIPAAGAGARLYPWSKSLPKEMLPLRRRPLIEWVLEEIAGAGIEEALIIISRDKSCIRDYFETPDPSDPRGPAAFRAVASLRNRMKISWGYQDDPPGLGSAVWQSKGFVGEEPFALCLADNASLGHPTALEGLLATGTCPAVALTRRIQEHVDVYPPARFDAKTGLVTGIGDVAEGVEAEQYRPAGRLVVGPEVFRYLEDTRSETEWGEREALGRYWSAHPAPGIVVDSLRHLGSWPEYEEALMRSMEVGR